MKKFLACCLSALCLVQSGCAGGQQKTQAPEPPQTSAQQETGTAEVAPQSAEPEAGVYADSYTGAWQDKENPQYTMNISSVDGTAYTIEIAWSGGSQSNTVWQLNGTYDSAWNGIAYVGAKYEDAMGADESVQRSPVPEREEITGLLCMEESGELSWIDDFDHTGDELHFVRA